jgi:hypothetical protein
LRGIRVITLDLDRGSEPLRDQLLQLQTEGAVFAAFDEPHGWQAAEDRLANAFSLSRACASQNAPIVFLVRSADVRGSRGPLPAAVACALISAARSLAIEGLKTRHYVNVVATDDTTSAEDVAAVVSLVLERPVMTGELIDVGTQKLGRVQP